MSLRQLPIADRHFWKPSLEEQLSQVVTDKRGNTGPRTLPKNEVTALALNEIAASRAFGFFSFLPNRGTLSDTNSSETLHPSSRRATQPGAKYPDLIYQPYDWPKQAVAHFKASSHRFRYLACNALVNPPQAGSTLYGIQLAAHKKHALYDTSSESLCIVLVTDTQLYAASTSDLCHPNCIGRVGHRPPSLKLAGPEPEKRLNTALYVWDGALGNQEKQRRLDQLQQYELVDGDDHTALEQLFEQIIDFANAQAPYFTPQQLAERLPRPSSPHPGTPLGQGTPSGEQQTVESFDVPPAKRRRLDFATASIIRGLLAANVKVAHLSRAISEQWEVAVVTDDGSEVYNAISVWAQQADSARFVNVLCADLLTDTASHRLATTLTAWSPLFAPRCRVLIQMERELDGEGIPESWHETAERYAKSVSEAGMQLAEVNGFSVGGDVDFCGTTAEDVHASLRQMALSAALLTPKDEEAARQASETLEIWQGRLLLENASRTELKVRLGDFMSRKARLFAAFR
ncbi:hypothetical protein LTR15_005590 [Elasticomyces elasticus]|nr:hypothetical protein LTR15_005590 [Elasticomyces elasticus]